MQAQNGLEPNQAAYGWCLTGLKTVMNATTKQTITQKFNEYLQRHRAESDIKYLMFESPLSFAYLAALNSKKII